MGAQLTLFNQSDLKLPNAIIRHVQASYNNILYIINGEIEDGTADDDDLQALVQSLTTQLPIQSINEWTLSSVAASDSIPNPNGDNVVQIGPLLYFVARDLP